MPAWLNRALNSQTSKTKMFVVGFTGTRDGMTDTQKETVKNILMSVMPNLFVHGDCIGADSDAHEICKLLDISVKLRPCDHPARAFCEGAIEIANVKSPLVRNKDVVDESNMMIATPATTQEVLRSGTWSTIRYAKKMNKQIFVVLPDGSIDTW